MDSTEKFWMVLWAYVLVGIVTIVACATISSVNEANRIAELIKGGTDPVAARCGVSGMGERSTTACTIWVTRR